MHLKRYSKNLKKSKCYVPAVFNRWAGWSGFEWR